MKKIQVQNQKKANAKRYVLFTVIFIALSVIMITNAFSNNTKLKEQNYNTVEGIVSVLEVKENEYELKIEGIEEVIILNKTTQGGLYYA